MKKDSYLVEKDLIHFRRATKEDNLSQIAELIYNTDPYIYPYWFDNNEDKCKDFFKDAILQEGFLFHYDNLYVAHDITTNEIIGVICAIDKSVNLNYNYEPLREINAQYKKVVDDYIKPILDEVEEYDKDTIYIPNVCINKELRGKRIGTKLLGYFISQMEKAGFNQFALDCLLHNLPAKNLYHGLGFKEMKLFNGFSGDNRQIDVVSFLRKKGYYLPEEFQK